MLRSCRKLKRGSSEQARKGERAREGRGERASKGRLPKERSRFKRESEREGRKSLWSDGGGGGGGGGGEGEALGALEYWRRTSYRVPPSDSLSLKARSIVMEKLR